VTHAAAAIENHTNRKRSVLAGELGDLLRQLVLGQFKVLFFQAGDEAIQGIGDRNRYQDEITIDADIGFPKNNIGILW
jgi:hypothetical protein